MTNPITREQLVESIAANLALQEQYTAELAAVQVRREWLMKTLARLEELHSATYCLLSYASLEGDPALGPNANVIPF